MGEFHLRQRAVLVVDRNAFHGIERGVMTIYYLAKDGIFRVQMGLLGIRDEELGLVGIRARICHCNDATGIELRVNDGHRRQAIDTGYEGAPMGMEETTYL